MTYGIKISKPGKDVKDETSEELLFDSSVPTMSLYKTGTYEYTFGSADPASFTDKIEDHNLGYIPGVKAYIDDGGTGDFGQPAAANNPHYLCPLRLLTYASGVPGPDYTMRIHDVYVTESSIYYDYTKDVGGSGGDAVNWNGDTFIIKYYLFLKEGGE